MEELLDTIKRIKSEKEKNGVSPTLISFSELQKERLAMMRDELNTLYKDKKIGISRLLNENAIKI